MAVFRALSPFARMPVLIDAAHGPAVVPTALEDAAPFGDPMPAPPPVDQGPCSQDRQAGRLVHWRGGTACGRQAGAGFRPMADIRYRMASHATDAGVGVPEA